MRVVIVGKGIGAVAAPQGEHTWGVNNLCLTRPVTLSFNMHDLDKHKNHPLFNKTIAHINKYNIPIVTQRVYEHIPSSIAFPLEEMPFKYFGNSIDYMIAYAVHLGATIIDIYGVAMLAGTEYFHQKPSLEFWIGYARGKGIDVNIHEPTNVCKNLRGLYGYDWDEEDMPHVLNRPENKENQNEI